MTVCFWSEGAEISGQPVVSKLSWLLQHRDFMAYMKINAAPAVAVILRTSAVAMVYNIFIRPLFTTQVQ